MFRVNNRYTRTRCEVFLLHSLKTPQKLKNRNFSQKWVIKLIHLWKRLQSQKYFAAVKCVIRNLEVEGYPSKENLFG